MVAEAENENSAARLVVSCPSCGRSEFVLRPDSKLRPVLSCAKCKVSLRLLCRYGDPMPLYKPRPAGSSEYYYDAPNSKSWWQGLIRQRDGFFRPVAISATLAACWDALLYYPGEGDRLCITSRSPAGAGERRAVGLGRVAEPEEEVK